MAELTSPQLPWEPDGTIVANIAIGNLREWLLSGLTHEGRVHAETLMTVTGALAGFAASNAVWETVVKPKKPIPPNGLMVITANNKEKFYFGDLINRYLIAEGTNPNPFALWNLTAAVAIQEGVPEAELPDVRDMFAHVSATVGGPEFGIPRSPQGHQPQYMPRQLLDITWAHAKVILSRAGPGPLKSVAPEHWPIVFGIVAQHLVRRAKDVLNPRISLILLMESAIAMSKVDPATVPQVPPVSKEQKS